MCVTHKIKIPQRSTLDRDANRTYAARNEESAYVPYCTVHWRHGKWVRSLGLGQPVRQCTEPCSPCCSIRRRGHSTVHSVLLRSYRTSRSILSVQNSRAKRDFRFASSKTPRNSSCFRRFVSLTSASELVTQVFPMEEISVGFLQLSCQKRSKWEKRISKTRRI